MYQVDLILLTQGNTFSMHPISNFRSILSVAAEYLSVCLSMLFYLSVCCYRSSHLVFIISLIVMSYLVRLLLFESVHILLRCLTSEVLFQDKHMAIVVICMYVPVK